MKNVVHTLLALFVVTLLAACSANSPTAAMTKYGSYLIKGDYKSFVDGLYTKNGLSDEDKQEFETLFKDKLAKDFDKKGGLKSYEITEEELLEEGKSALLKVKSTYGNGTTEEGEQRMILVDGVWKMDMGK